MVVIGFDTATAATSVAAVRDRASAFSARESATANGRPRHASLLLPLIEQAAEAAGGWTAVRRIAVGVGPGTFTGIRIGVVTGRALALAHRCELAAVETTHALASRLARDAGEPACGVVDGKRGEVFAGLVAGDGSALWGPVLATPPELAGRLDEEGFAGPLAGDGAVLHADVLVGGSDRRLADPDHHLVDAQEICRIGAAAQPVEAAALAPIYIRRPDAERWSARDA